MNVPTDLRYTTSHEWVRRDQGKWIVGITEHAQEELKDVVFVELPQAGRAVKAGEAVAVIESVKAAFDIYAPVSGKIAGVNESLTQSPELVNQDCYSQGWLFAIEASDAKEWDRLKAPEDYERLIQTEVH